MSESVPRSTVAVFSADACTAGLACPSPDVAATTPIATCSWELLRLPVNPAGSKSLHALSARLKAAELVFRAEPFATASIVNAPDASGSGNAPTPLERMHSANFTALARIVDVPVAPLRRCPQVPQSDCRAVLPQPALIATIARAAPAHVLRLTTDPRLLRQEMAARVRRGVEETLLENAGHSFPRHMILDEAETSSLSPRRRVIRFGKPRPPVGVTPMPKRELPESDVPF